MSSEREPTKKKSSLVRLAMALLGGTVAVVIGFAIIYAAVSVASGAIVEPNIQALLNFSLFGFVLTVSAYYVSGLKKNSFFNAARIVFLAGLCGLGMLAIVAVSMGSYQIRGGAVQGCSSNVSGVLSQAQSATVPIGTDKGTGTGFYVTDDGKILTAYHVIEGVNELYINYATGKVPLTVVDRAPDYDLALLTPSSPLKEQISYLRLTANYAVGDSVMAIGFPGNALFAGQSSVSAGVISRIIGTDDLKLNEANMPSNMEIVQTDSALNHGNSGGPLFGRCGVVGIVNSKSDNIGLAQYGLSSEEGISYTISSKSAAARFSLPIAN